MSNADPHVIDVSEARIDLDPLLDRVERGEVVVITRHGRWVARLVPCAAEADRSRIRATIEELKEFGAGIRLPEGVTLGDLLNDGRM